MKNKEKIFILFVIVLAITIVGGFKFYQNKPAKKPAENSFKTVYKTSKNIPLEITLIPKNASKFDLEVVESNNCGGNPGGVTSYRDATAAAVMDIWSDKLKGDKNTKKGLEDLNKLLSSPLSLHQNLDWIEMMFFSYCGGSGHMDVLKELPVNYAGVDKVKAMTASFSQSMFGDVDVYIVGKKGDNYFRLKKQVSTSDEVNKFVKICESKSAKGVEAQSNCYWNLLETDPSVQQRAEQTVKELTTLFALQ